jgi:hypothetical protein
MDTLENIMPSKRSQLGKTTYSMIPLNKIPRIGKSIEKRKQTSGCQGLGLEENRK